MSGGVRRSLADLSCRGLQAILPLSLRSWGCAVRCETAEIPDDTEALLFALGSLFGLMPRALATHLLHRRASPTCDGGLLSGGSITMNAHPRRLGTTCAIGAVILGLVYMAIAGAPARYLAINVGALVIGLAVLATLGRNRIAGQRWAGGTIAAMAGVLLATALLGNTADGAARWVKLGGLSIQPSLVLLPLMLVLFARTSNALATAGLIAAAVAMALQPDRAMAGMLAASLAVLAMMRSDRHVVAALGASVTGFAMTLARADTLPAVPYVDQILYTSFDVHAAAGAAVLGGCALLLVPAITGWTRDPARREIYAVFGAVWFTAILAAALGNYPTPIVGYGGSAIIGYALSLLALPKRADAELGAGSCPLNEADAMAADRQLLLAPA